MSGEIPVPVIAVVADVLATRYTHSRIDYFMEAAGVQGLPPGGNKVDKSRLWLKQANQWNADPLATLGKVIAELMEVNSSGYASGADLDPEREKIRKVLSDHGLGYVKGGFIARGGASVAARTLQDVIRQRDLSGLQTEFDRIYDNLESDPAAAVTASCALLESLFKYYIEEKNLEMPSEQSIRPLWKTIRKDLNFDPAMTEDNDLKAVLTGLASIVEGIGSLRTHKGSAHGRGKTVYKLQPRHARLAAHAAFTLASFVLETWG
ncbi:MAG: abortive infection family protein [Candidatus Acidiferrales bacterium]